MRGCVSVAFVFVLVWACTMSNAAVPTGGMNMYEISTRPWLYNLTQKYNRPIQTLAAIPLSEIQDLKSVGIDIVWMMGVWELGNYGINFDRTNSGLLQHYSQVLPGYTTDDIIGSPYAVVNYTCNPSLGSDDDIRTLRKNMNKMGLLLMLDFVPNHTAVDCPWTNSTPAYYIQAPKGSSPPYDPQVYYSNGLAYGGMGWGDPWWDTLQLNIWNPETRAIRTQQLLHVASLADAIRCDMAYLLINQVFGQSWSSQLNSWGWKQPATEWWSDAIQTVKASYPNTIFLAEVYSPYEPTLQSLGFDYTYDKQVHDRLGSNDLDSLRSWLTSNTAQYFQHAAHFVSNHDEQRGAAFFGSWWQSDAAALLSYTLPGLRFFWMGDFEGYKYQLDVHLRREEAEPAVPQVMPFYQSLLQIIGDPVFRQGSWKMLQVTESGSSDSSWRLIAYMWTYQNERRLCVVNYSDQQGWGDIVVPNAVPVNGNDTIPVTDLLSGQTFYRSAKQMQTAGLTVGINSWYASIFKY